MPSPTSLNGLVPSLSSYARPEVSKPLAAKPLTTLGKIVQWVQQNEKKGTLCKVATLALVYFATILLSLSMIGIPVIHAYNREYLRQNQERDFQAFLQVEKKKEEKKDQRLEEDKKQIETLQTAYSQLLKKVEGVETQAKNVDQKQEERDVKTQEKIKRVKILATEIHTQTEDQQKKIRNLETENELLKSKLDAIRQDVKDVEQRTNLQVDGFSEKLKLVSSKLDQSRLDRLNQVADKIEALPIDHVFFEKVRDAETSVSLLEKQAVRGQKKFELLQGQIEEAISRCRTMAANIVKECGTMSAKMVKEFEDLTQREKKNFGEIAEAMAEGMAQASLEIDELTKKGRYLKTDVTELHEKLQGYWNDLKAMQDTLQKGLAQQKDFSVEEFRKEFAPRLQILEEDVLKVLHELGLVPPDAAIKEKNASIKKQIKLAVKKNKSVESTEGKK